MQRILLDRFYEIDGVYEVAFLHDVEIVQINLFTTEFLRVRPNFLIHLIGGFPMIKIDLVPQSPLLAREASH